MNINIIEKALTSMLLSTHTSKEEAVDVLKALQEIASVKEVDKSADCWNNDAVLLPANAWTDLLNHYTYDILGRHMRKHDSNVPLSYYVHDVRKEVPGMDEVPVCYLKYGYEVCKDLWQDNEAEGNNDTDGAFKRD